MKFKVGDVVNIRNYGKGVIVMTDLSKTDNPNYDYLIKLEIPKECFYNEKGKDTFSHDSKHRFFWENEIDKLISKKSTVEIY